MSWEIACVTNVGGRKNNEDAADYEQSGETYCLMVADGVGGYQHGEYASNFVVQAIKERFLREPKAEAEILRKHLWEVVKEIAATIQTHPNLEEMRTTLSVVYLAREQAVVGYVGDSRVYVFHQQKILYSSRDHSVVMHMAMRGQLPMEEIRCHPQRNRITSSLGKKLPKEMGIVSLQPGFKAGDGVILCSDGFWELITEQEMLEALSISSSAEKWVREMERKVGNRLSAHSDNYTCLAALRR